MLGRIGSGLARIPFEVEFRHLEISNTTYCFEAQETQTASQPSRPQGLIRRDSLNALAGRAAKFWRPRLFLSMVVGCVGTTAFAYATQQVKPVINSVLRMQGAPYFRDENSIRNNFMVRPANERAVPFSRSISRGAMNAGLLCKRPWLLVSVAFRLLIGGWVATFRLCFHAVSGHLTPEQETALLQGRAGQ
jgi:hypothetical protein